MTSNIFYRLSLTAACLFALMGAVAVNGSSRVVIRDGAMPSRPEVKISKPVLGEEKFGDPMLSAEKMADPILSADFGF